MRTSRLYWRLLFTTDYTKGLFSDSFQSFCLSSLHSWLIFRFTSRWPVNIMRVYIQHAVYLQRLHKFERSPSTLESVNQRCLQSESRRPAVFFLVRLGALLPITPRDKEAGADGILTEIQLMVNISWLQWASAQSTCQSVPLQQPSQSRDGLQHSWTHDWPLICLCVQSFTVFFYFLQRHTSALAGITTSRETWSTVNIYIYIVQRNSHNVSCLFKELSAPWENEPSIRTLDVSHTGIQQVI